MIHLPAYRLQSSAATPPSGRVDGPVPAAGVQSVLSIVAVLCLILTGCGREAEEPCIAGATALTAALDAASEGDAVRLCGGVRLEGAFEVPAGVILEGDGTGTLVGQGGAVLVLVPGPESMPTTVRGLELEVPAGGPGTPAGVVAVGPGHVDLADIHITLGAGIGVVVSGTAGVRFHGVDIDGGRTAVVTRTNVAATDVPVAGVLVESPEAGDCTLAEFMRLSIRGAVGLGVSIERPCQGSSVEQVAVRDIIGTGVVVRGEGTVAVQELLVSGVRGREVVASDAVSYGVALFDGAQVELRAVAVVDVADAAVALSSATLAAEGLVVLGARGPGLVASDGQVRLEGVLVRGTLDAGIVLRASEADAASVWIGDVEAATVMDSMARIAWSGDGVRSYGAEGRESSVLFSRTTVSAPARAGLVGAEGAVSDGEAGAIVVCDDVPVEGSWSCTSDAQGTESCVLADPPAAEEWTCQWESGALTCTADVEADLPEPEVLPGDLETACAGALRDVLAHQAMSALVARSGVGVDAVSPRGIIGEDGTMGFREAGMDVGAVRTGGRLPWQCTEGSGGRTCRLADPADRSAPTPLHPGGLETGAWRCVTESTARVCERSTIAAGMIEGAMVSPELVVPRGEALEQRTAQAAIAPPELPFGRGAPAMPRLPEQGFVDRSGALRELSSSPFGLEAVP